MIEYTGKIKDVYGITHTDPVFALESASIANNTGKHMHYNAETDEYQQSESSHLRVDYAVIFWTNQQEKDAGALHMQFGQREHAGNNNFAFAPTPEAADSELSELCLAHFIAEILPHYVVEQEPEE